MCVAVFRVEELPFGEGDGNGEKLEGLGEGMRWDVCRRGDVKIVQSRTIIPRQEWVLLLFRPLLGGFFSGEWARDGADGLTGRRC
jgi:hypothetical protein